MIGNSVVPGLPNRCVMPSSFSNARKADRPVMRFFMFPPARGLVGLFGMGHHDRLPMPRSNRVQSWLPCVRVDLHSKHPFAVAALLLFRALPDHTGIAF